MTVELLRRHYGIFVLDSRQERAEPTLSILRDSGYDPYYFGRYEDLVTELVAKPPHVVIFHRSDEVNSLSSALPDLKGRLPETHFIILTAASGWSVTWREWGSQVYDCVLSPPVHPLQLVKTLDRAADRDSWMYRAESLEDQLSQATPLQDTPLQATPLQTIPDEEVSLSLSLPSSSEFSPDLILSDDQDGKTHEGKEDTKSFLAPVPETDWGGLWKQLACVSLLEDLEKETVRILSELAAGAPALFLRYFANRRCLVISSACSVASHEWEGLGLNLNEVHEFKVRDLEEPEKIGGLKEMAQTLAGHERMWVRPFRVRENIYGLFLVLSQLESAVCERLDLVLRMAEERALVVDLQQHLHAVEIRDGTTQLLSRAHLMTRLTLEVARARRVELPVSFVLISLDQYQEILQVYGHEELQLTLRALGKIIAPRSRVNDILGRIGVEDLGLILPHTSARGAGVKAERLRRLVEAADFSRLLPQFQHLTVTLGVSEYPTCCRDAEDLFSTADDALWQMKGKQNNKVCLSTPKPGFNPDFLATNEV